MLKKVFIYGFIGGAFGYLILHPISMIIVKMTENVPDHPHDNIIGMAFSLHHLPMGLYFSLLCTIFGLLAAFYNNIISEKSQHIQLLEGLLPICSNCKAIRDDNKSEKGKGDWIKLETYFNNKSKIDFSHGICPDCMKKLYSKL